MAGYNYLAGTEVAKFVTASKPVDIIQGPLGSGKTRALCVRVLRHAQEQVPSPLDGVRHSRFAIVRNTMPDLRRTTIRAWLEVCPESIYGRFTYGASMHHDLDYMFGNTRIICTVDFLSLDKDEDVRKLRSTEYTGIAFNELSFIIKDLFIEARSRLRFPGPEHGGPNPWRGVIGDTNAPDEDHWLSLMTGQVDPPPGLPPEEMDAYRWPKEWGFYLQPPALLEKRDQRGKVIGYEINPKAENLRNLPDINSPNPGHAYYMEQLAGGPSLAWIDSRLMNRVALVVDGDPVWPMFRREFHVASEPLKPLPGYDVHVWLDFGRVYPAALFAQVINQRVYIQYEILGFNEPASVFAPKVKRFLADHYQNCTPRFTGDPKGRDKGQQQEQSSYDIFAAHAMRVNPAQVPGNDIATRTEAVAYALNDNPSGVNTLVFSPLCRTLIVGCAGRYHLTRQEKNVLKPEKDKYSNLCDCLQYGVISLGMARKMIGMQPIGDVKPMQIYRGRKTMRRVMS